MGEGIKRQLFLIQKNLREINGATDMLIRLRIAELEAAEKQVPDVKVKVAIKNDLEFLRQLRRTIASRHAEIFPEDRELMEKIFGKDFDSVQVEQPVQPKPKIEIVK